MSVGGISGKYTTRPSSSFVKVIHSPNLEFGVNNSSSMTSSRVCSALNGSGTLSTQSGLMSTWECVLCGPSPYKSSVQISLCFTELGALTLVFTSIGSLCILAISTRSIPHVQVRVYDYCSNPQRSHVRSASDCRCGSRVHHPSLNQRSSCDCVCVFVSVCVWERERERERDYDCVCVCVCVCDLTQMRGRASVESVLGRKKREKSQNSKKSSAHLQFLYHHTHNQSPYIQHTQWPLKPLYTYT